MSLNIYTSLEDVKKAGLKLIRFNDAFFGKIALRDSDTVKHILMSIDKAKRHTEDTFISRDEELGAFNKERLSTGCKTLLNILEEPSMCFDVSECGSNALRELSTIREGNIYWECPVLQLTRGRDCDIMLHDKNGSKHFKTFCNLFRYTMDGEYYE